MSVGLFEYWLRLTLDKVFKDAAEAAVPGLLVQLDGMRGAATESAEEWVRFNVLDTAPLRQRAGQWFGPVMAQISVFSRFSEKRADTKRRRPSEIAGLIINQIVERSHLVKDFDQLSPQERGTVWLHKPKRLVRLDEDEIAQAPRAGRVPSAVHGIAATLNGTAQLIT